MQHLITWASTLVRDGDLDLDAGLDVDGGDLLDDLSRGVQVDQALVDPKAITSKGRGSECTKGSSACTEKLPQHRQCR